MRLLPGTQTRRADRNRHAHLVSTPRANGRVLELWKSRERPFDGFSAALRGRGGLHSRAVGQCAQAQSPRRAAFDQDNKDTKSPGWFTPLGEFYAEMTPRIAGATARVMKSVLSPGPDSISPGTAGEAMNSIRGELERRQSQRIADRAAAAAAKRYRESEAEEGRMLHGANVAAKRAAIAGRPVLTDGFRMDLCINLV